MIKIEFSKLKNGNLEITEKMLNDTLSYMKRQENYIKRLKQENERLNNIRQTALHLVFHNDVMDYRVFEESLEEILRGNIDLNYGYTDEFINSILNRYDKIKELCNDVNKKDLKINRLINVIKEVRKYIEENLVYLTWDGIKYIMPSGKRILKILDKVEEVKDDENE